MVLDPSNQVLVMKTEMREQMKTKIFFVYFFSHNVVEEISKEKYEALRPVDSLGCLILIKPNGCDPPPQITIIIILAI